MDGERVTSPAFGNKRKRILFAHTEENSSFLPHETRRAWLGLPEGRTDTHTNTHTHTLPPVPFDLYQPPALAARPRSAVGHRLQDLEGRGAGWGLLPGTKDTEEAKGQRGNLRV